MFYKYRKQIVTVFIILVLIGDFLLGKSIESSSFYKSNNKSKSTVTAVEQNKNYQQEIDINGQGYSSSITIDKAAIVGDGQMSFSVIESQSTSVVGYKVVALGSDNNILNVQQTTSDATQKTYTYSVQFDNSKDKKITIQVYPLTQSMSTNTNLSLNDAAYGEASLYIDLIKQSTINQIQGTDGASSGN